jgi:hypothetical protein
MDTIYSPRRLEENFERGGLEDQDNLLEAVVKQNQDEQSMKYRTALG